MFNTIYKIVTAKMYRHIDTEIGLLRRVGGMWRVENPKKTLGVSIKIYGSDRFGPNKKALSEYKKYKDQLEIIWLKCRTSIIDETRLENGTPRFAENEFVVTEIIFGSYVKSENGFAFAFNIESAPNEYGAVVKDGEYKCYYSLYGPDISANKSV